MSKVQIEIKARASKIKIITIDDAKTLPGLLGKIVPVQLKENGWYAHNSNGTIIYYELPA